MLWYPRWLIQFSGPTPGFVQARIYALEREERLISSIGEAIRRETAQWRLARLRSHNAQLLVSKLPDELLAHVFVMLRGNDDRRSLERAIQVCHRWRRVACKQGALWSEIKILSSRRSLEKAEAYLARSGTFPITITINFIKSRIVDHDFCHDLSERIIVPHASRYTAFTFVSPAHYPMDRVRLFPIPAPTPNLRSLVICVNRSQEPLPQIFSARNAEEIYLNSVQLFCQDCSIQGTLPDSLSMQSLTSLEFNGSHDQTAPDVLQRCSALKTLIWCCNPPAAIVANLPRREIHLAELLVAHLHGALPLVLNLRAPKLQCLDIAMPDCRNQPGAVMPGLLSGQPRFPLLKNVCFQSTSNLTPALFCSFLAMHSALETLVLQDMPSDVSGVDILNRLERRPCLRLRCLYIKFIHPLARTPIWPPVPAPDTSSFAFRLGTALLRILRNGPEQPPPSSISSDSLLHITILDLTTPPRDFGGEIATHPRVKFLSSFNQFVAERDAFLSV